MKNRIAVLAVFTFCIFLSGKVFAQTEQNTSATDSIPSSNGFKHAINFCPGALAFGIYSMNYEYRFSAHHGLVGRFDYEAIPKTYTDAAIESSGVGFALNYCWHISGKMKSIFLGAYSRYRIYSGNGTIEATAFDFTLDELTFGLNAGKRWVWKSGFNLTFALGYGFSIDSRDADPSNVNIEPALNRFEDDYDFTGPFFGELSIGYSF